MDVMTTTSQQSPGPRSSLAFLGRRLQPYWFLMPAAAYLAAFLGYPLARGIGLSLTDTRLTNPYVGTSVGLDNYRRIITSEEFWHAVRLTGIYTAGCVLGALSLGLAIALLVNSDRVPGRGLFRVALTAPWATPTVAAALVFAWILNGQYGAANRILTQVGITDTYQAWLTDPRWAMPIVTLVTIWKIFPFAALVLLAALQTVPNELYEAADLDGADGLAKFRNITLPTIAPAGAVLTLFITIWSIRRFEIIWLLTGGGPRRATETLVIDLYKEGFANFNLGRSAAYGVLGLIISIGVTIAFFAGYRRLGRRTGAEI